MAVNGEDNSGSEQDGGVAWATHLLLFFKGVAMGLGDSVPGISGGTIAVITNIYDKLIFSIKSIDLQVLKLVFSGRIAQAWQHINGTFLAVLAAGILSGLLVSASTVLYLLENEFEVLMAFFLGLVLASSWLLKDEFKRSDWRNWVALIIGASLTLSVGMISPRVADLNLFYVFFSGAIAICAMILPGLSGAFILILLGVYEFILGALVGLDVAFLLVFAAGCALGLMVFSRVLARLLVGFHELSYACITGMLLGSISVLWPWQQVVSSYTDSGGELHALQTANILPTNYLAVSGNAPSLIMAIFCAFGGAVIVLVLHKVFETPAQD